MLLLPEPKNEVPSPTQLAQCDWLVPILNNRNKLAGVVKCPADKSFELWNEMTPRFAGQNIFGFDTFEIREAELIGIFCSRHFFKMLSMRAKHNVEHNNKILFEW